MLISWLVLAIGQLSASELPLIDVASNVTSIASRPTVQAITPGEPSTLAEALIGATFIAAYLLFSRPMRGRRRVQRISKPGSAGSGRKAA
jgi:hypothetical protein